MEKKRAHERARWWSLRKHCMIQAKWEEWDKCLLYKENPKVAGFSPSVGTQVPTDQEAAARGAVPRASVAGGEG